ncbi:hypothetical protein SteCoe_17426 [Stentor coeruleus]|uniref:HhH-GPD domain-containing protein n=1 Tax=Stentor coeruleus TaxID=5963 RepID=A0A1R2BYW9_9CILI|nr:hypothetical protein SteCoe_17426 [Stentor coeruleus]
MVKKFIKDNENHKKEKKQCEDLYMKLKKLRKNFIAPVDERIQESTNNSDFGSEDFKFSVFVRLIIGSRTKDSAVAKKIEYLKSKGLTINSILDHSQETLAYELKGVSFPNNKAKYLIKSAKIIKNNYNGIIPDTYKDLISLPGLGPRTANMFLHICYGKTEGIIVDSNIHRIANRLGLVKTETEKQTQKELEKIVPKTQWKDLYVNLLGFSQVFCSVKNPDCEKCPASDICDYTKKYRKIEF